MKRLTYGQKIPLMNGNTIEIIDFINDGGQGTIYSSTNHKVVKMMKEKNEALQRNIEGLLQIPSPYPNFTWPLALTKEYQGTFGYVMKRIPKDYFSFYDYLYDEKCTLNLEERLQIGYGIASSFHALHQNGLIYHDINPGGIYLNPKNKSVIICDVDNCNQGQSSFVLGTPGYMAPELICKQSGTNLYTDYYSLAVILFQLFCIDHPLKGKRYYAYCKDDHKEDDLLGYDPIFVLDPNDSRNTLCGEKTKYIEAFFKRYPSLLQETFTYSFTTGLKDPKRRISDQKWMEIIEQCYQSFVKQEKRSGFMRKESFHGKVLKIKEKEILLGNQKVIYAYQFNSNEFFMNELFVVEGDQILSRSNELMINDQHCEKGKRYPIQKGDLITYHQVNGKVE